MKSLSRTLLWSCLGLSTAFSPVFADTLVTNKGPQGKEQKVYISAEGARMEAHQAGQYVLMQFEGGKMYAINPQQKQVLDLNTAPPAPSAAQLPPGMPKPAPAPEVKAELIKVGLGPEIAGFKTEHYQVKANGEVCENEYLSAEALEVPHIKAFMKQMQSLSEKRKQQRGNLPFMRVPPCVEAAEKVSAQYLQLGLPLRTENAKGEVRNEVSSINTDATAPAGSFELPKDYAVVDPAAMLRNAMRHAGQGNAAPGMPMAPPAAAPKQ